MASYQAGTGLVNILPSFRDFSKQLAKALGKANTALPVGAQFDAASLESQINAALNGANSSVEISATADTSAAESALNGLDPNPVTVQAGADTSAATSALGSLQSAAPTVTVPVDAPDASPGLFDSFRAGALVAGAAIGAAFMSAFTEGMNREALGDKMAAQLGQAEPDAARFGAIAGRVYANNFGASMEEVSAAVVSVTKNLAGLNASGAEIQALTQSALGLSAAFDQDVNEVVRATSQLLNNGLAPDAQSALDIMAVGFAGSANRADDFLDTINEYSPVFAQLGLDGGQAVGLINQALLAGAPNADFFADALKEMTIILQAMPNASDVFARAEANKAAAVESANARVASALQGVQAAQKGLASAQKAAGDAAAGVAKAQDAAADAAAQVGKVSADAAKAVTAAQKQHQAALRGVASAQRAAQDAQKRYNDSLKAEKDAQDALIDARAEAAQQIRDLENAQSSAANRIESARIAQMRAQNAADEAAGRAATYSEEEIERAQVALDLKTANEDLAQAQREAAESAAELSEAQAEGVDGSDAVQAAQEALRAAQDGVAESAQGIADANLAVADAVNAAAEAEANIADVRAQGAEAVAAAEERAAEARAAIAEAEARRAEAQAAVQDAQAAVGAAGGELGAAQADLAAAEAAPLDLAAAGADPAMLALIALGLDPAAIQAAINQGGEAAEGAFVEIQTRLQNYDGADKQQIAVALMGAKAEDLQGVFDGIDYSNMTTGLSDIEGAANRAGDQMSSNMASDMEAAKRSVMDFALGVGNAVLPALATLLDGLKKVGGFVRDVLKPAWEAFDGALGGRGLEVVVGVLGTLATAMLAVKGATALASGVMNTYNAALTLGRGVMTAVSNVTKIWTGIQAAFNAVMALNPITLIVLAIAALVAGLILAYQHSETFRNIVQAVWDAIKVAVQFVWESVLKPIFEALKTAFIAVGDAIMWVWESVIKPAWDALSAAFSFLWNNIILPYINAWKFAFGLLGDAIMWVWNNVIKVAWDAIKVAWEILWGFLSGAFDLAKAGFQALGDGIMWVYDNIIKKAFEGIKTTFENVWNGVKYIFELFTGAWNGVSDAIGWVGDKIHEVFDGITDFLAPIFETVMEILEPVVELFEKLWSVVEKIGGAIGGVVDGIGSVVGAVGGFLGFANGGIYPGYTPGKDIGLVGISGGEAVMRPEWTRAVGPDFVHQMNAIARRGGINAVRAAMNARFYGGFADGGVVDLAASLRAPAMPRMGDFGVMPVPTSGGGLTVMGNVIGTDVNQLASELHRRERQAASLVPAGL